MSSLLVVLLLGAILILAVIAALKSGAPGRCAALGALFFVGSVAGFFYYAGFYMGDSLWPVYLCYTLLCMAAVAEVAAVVLKVRRSRRKEEANSEQRY